MATDAAQLAERFREICQEWDLDSGEAEIQAQNKALAPLHDWLLTGVDSPEVVIRAVQVLMADPERPAIHKRPAVKHVFKQVAQAWGSAGLKERDVRILRGMLLAAWPQDLGHGGFALAPLLDSAWAGIKGRLSKEKQLEEWRMHAALGTWASPPDEAQPSPSNQSSIIQGLKALKLPEHVQEIEQLKASGDPYAQTLAIRSAQLFKYHQDILGLAANHLNATQKTLAQFETRVSELSNEVSDTAHALGKADAQASQLNLLWWGQARYSSITRLPYRRISDATERLWWMAWESAEVGMELEVEPAACFFIETLYQLDKRADAPKRPLKEWLAELLEALRRIHGNGQQHVEAMTMSDHLENLAGQDLLGLPVTWARLQAANPKPFEGSLEERIRTDVAVDPDTLLDLGDWAAWVFREALLDHRLWEFGD